MVTDQRARPICGSTYAADHGKPRINLGIRRRLAPLLEHDQATHGIDERAAILTMPGTPVIYYGDEIGMGDNIHLGDRDGVRTPMQWSPDRNGGFSRAAPERSRVAADHVTPSTAFDAVNVESQHGVIQHSPAQLVRVGCWSVRRRNPAFGRGTLRFLYPSNRKVLAFLQRARWTREHPLCQPTWLAHRAGRGGRPFRIHLAGRTPVDLIGAIDQLPPDGTADLTSLPLPPYAFYWFKS